MSDHVAPGRKPYATHATPAPPGAARRNAAPVAALAATGRLLNARPALTAQRAVAEGLSHQPQGGGATHPIASASPVQLMDGQPAPAPDEDEWGGFQGAAPVAAPDAAAPMVVAPAAAPAPDPHAGHGLEVGIGAHHAANGPMYTTDLFNCIALVAYNPATPLACLYHWNTVDAFMVEDDDAEGDVGAGEPGLVPDQQGIAAARAVVDGGAPGATLYCAVLGGSWDDADHIAHRPAFEAALTAGFGTIAISPTRHRSARWAAPDLIGYG